MRKNTGFYNVNYNLFYLKRKAIKLNGKSGTVNN